MMRLSFHFSTTSLTQWPFFLSRHGTSLPFLFSFFFFYSLLLPTITFFLPVAELFRYNNGEEWMVSHFLFQMKWLVVNDFLFLSFSAFSFAGDHLGLRHAASDSDTRRRRVGGVSVSDTYRTPIRCRRQRVGASELKLEETRIFYYSLKTFIILQDKVSVIEARDRFL